MLLILTASVFSQFANFFQQGDSNFQFMFNGQQMNQRCNRYQCPSTKRCVDKPVDCPCEDAQIKCPYGDWYYCLDTKRQCEDITELGAHYPNK